MDEDKAAVLEMNKRIMIDLQKIELDRSAQITKLILRFAAALADNSQRVHQVFHAQEIQQSDIRKVKSQLLEVSITEGATEYDKLQQ